MSKTNQTKQEVSSYINFEMDTLRMLIRAQKRCTRWRDLLITDGEPELLTATNEIYTRDSQDAHSTITWMARHGFSMAAQMGPGVTFEKPKAPTTAGGRAALMAYLHGMTLGYEELATKFVSEFQTHADALPDDMQHIARARLDKELASHKTEADPTPTSDDVVP